VAAGCGGGESSDRLTKEEYLQEFEGIVSDLEAEFGGLLEGDLDTSDFDALADQVDQLGDGFDELTGRVEALNPPEEVQQTHDKLVEGLDEFAGWAHDLADKVRTAPASELVALLEEYGFSGEFDPTKIPGADKIQEAIDEFEAAGYTLGETETETATTEAEPAPPDADAAAGKEVFVSNCGSCHTLADAGSTGAIGPDLDSALPSYALALDRVTNGQGVMPPFAGQLTEEEIRDVAAYVSSVAGG
jgi:mono/diheme cytochrome c family protein